MKKLILILFLCYSWSVAFGQNQGVLTGEKISFTFVSKKVDGSLDGFNSTSRIDTSDITNSKFEGSVKTETLDSGNFLRNWSLKGGKYFDVDTYPTMRFKSSSVTGTLDKFQVEGQLTIKEIEKTITILFTKEGDRIIGTTTIFSSDFGITVIKKGREANKVVIKMSFQLK